MDELQVNAAESKPVYRVSAAGLDPRDVRLIEIVFKHSQYNPFGFVLDAKLDPEAVDILIVNPAESEGLRAVARVRTVGRQVPVISAVPRDAPSTGRHAISIDRLTLQLLPILNRVVELELDGGRAAAVPASQPAQPQVQSGVPRSQAVLPQAEPARPQAEPVIPRAESAMPRIEPAMPRVEPAVPRAEAGIPRVEASMPRAGAGMPSVEPDTAQPRSSVPHAPAAQLQPLPQRSPPQPQPAAAASATAATPQAPTGAMPPSSPADANFAQSPAATETATSFSPSLAPSSSLQLPAAPAVSTQVQAPGTPANPLHLDLPTRDFLRRAADKSREGDQLREQASRNRWQPEVGQLADAGPPGLQWMLRKPDTGLPPVPPLDVSQAGAPQARQVPESRSSLPVGLADLQLPDLNLPDLRLPERAPMPPGAVGQPGAQGGAAVQSAASGQGMRATPDRVQSVPQAPEASNAPAGRPAGAGAAAGDFGAASPGSLPSLPAWARDPLPAAVPVRQGGGLASSLLSNAAPAAAVPTATGAGAGAAAPSNLVALPLNTEVPPARIRVLVVDDSPTVRQQLARAFARMAIICDAAASAAEALQRLAERHFDLVLVDVVMPDVDGYKLTRQIRRKHRGTPVIILTSRSSPFDLARGALAGCHTYLVKPVPLKQLESAVAKLLRKSLAIDDLTGMIRLSSDAPAKAPEASRAPDASGAPNPRSPRSAGE